MKIFSRENAILALKRSFLFIVVFVIIKILFLYNDGEISEIYEREFYVTLLIMYFILFCLSFLTRSKKRKSELEFFEKSLQLNWSKMEMFILLIVFFSVVFTYYTTQRNKIRRNEEKLERKEKFQKNLEILIKEEKKKNDTT